MKKTLLILLFFLNLNMFPQAGSKEFAKHINQSIYSFKKVNTEKYQAIRGIEIEFNPNYKIFSYKLIFEDNKIVLTEKEYKYILKKIKCKPFKKHIKNLHEISDYDKKENLKYKIKYIEPA